MATSSAHANQYFSSNEFQISNNFFNIAFDREKGIFNINRKDGRPFIMGASASLNLTNERLSLKADHNKHSASVEKFSDLLGPGKKLIIHSKDGTRKIDFEVHLSLFDYLKAISIKAICKNVSGQDIVIRSIEPLRVLETENGKLVLPGVTKCITNGQMYFDAGTIHTFGEKPLADSKEGIKNIEFANSSIPGNQESIHTWWNLGLFSGYDREAIIIGWLENKQSLGHVTFARTGQDEISLVAESIYLPGQLLPPAKSLSSDPIILISSNNPYSALENYGDVVGKMNQARTNSIINGWCSWFYTLAKVSEEEVIANTKFAAEHLKPFGIEFIQIDEGYQQWHGDWRGNERFPHGLKWLADQIKSHGLKPGIWIAPYVISEPTEIFQQHPDWLVSFPDGKLQRVGNWAEPPSDENPRRYCLDITHPQAAQWLYDTIKMIVDEWGFEMIKIDFVAWSILSANRFREPTQSAAQVYRKGMEIMRKAAGDKCHILDCGPGNITVGLIDSMRIEWDVNYGYSVAAWDTYFMHPAGSAAAMGKRFYFHRKAWINDADHLCMDLLNNQQSEAAATLIALSGGNLFSGDRLTQLDPHKLEILKKITPSYGKAAIPVDLFESNIASVFALEIKKTFADWTVLGFFNADLNETRERRFAIQRLGLNPNKKYLVFDFWKQAFLGEINGELKVSIQPGSTTLLTLHESTGKPQFISTDRHVLQGAVELEDAHWDDVKKIFAGISIGPPGSSHNVYIYIPQEHPWGWNTAYTRYRDYDQCSLKLVECHIIRVHLRFDKADRIAWEIPYDDFFNTPGP
jgi:alpha-galactosidase